MEKRGLILNKRGETLIFETVIFIVLNTLFFVIMLVFVSRASTGAAVYEQVYAKEIALMIDDAKPTMSIYIDMGDAVKLTEKIGGLNLIDIVRIDESGQRVVVSLTKGGGYSFQYFSGYNVTVEPAEENFLKINVGEKVS